MSTAAAASDSASVKSPHGPVDMHVHIVGNGRAGSGCWLRLAKSRQWMANFMLRQLGLGTGWDAPEFDAAYVDFLLRWLDASSLSHAVILAHEEVYDENGQRLDFGSFHVPNDYVLDLAAKHSGFLPAVSIHPARRDAMEELDRCLERGAAMLKILPNCQNINCSRPAYRRFWERMAEAGLPLLAHTGGEHTVPQFQPKYSDPAVLRLPLECGVNVIAAHCGTKSGIGDPDYLPRLLHMMDRWPNLYGDLSALNLPLRSAGLAKLLRMPQYHDRLIHGSDFPVPVQPLWARLRGLITSGQARFLRKESNVLERDYQLKRAMGFPPEVFTRIRDLLRVDVTGK
ncbi:MAG: amidohydrolase family protein [Verrucomicrobiota bacterium]